MSTEHRHGTDHQRALDVLAVGEILLDLIAEEAIEDLADASCFRRYAGGSVANLAANLARQGRRVALVGCVGEDGPGRFLRGELRRAGLPEETVAVKPGAPTSLALVSRNVGTPDFVVYRGADAEIERSAIARSLARSASILHTSCFALSRQPARDAILAAAAEAASSGTTLSIDLNYAPEVWPERHEAQQAVSRYLACGKSLVKASADDLGRLFGSAGRDLEATGRRLHRSGAGVVCITEGRLGSRISWAGGEQRRQIPGRTVPVADATGAGDAFWAGFLTAWLDGRGPAEAARAGSVLAARKLAVVGPLNTPVPERELFGEELEP